MPRFLLHPFFRSLSICSLALGLVAHSDLSRADNVTVGTGTPASCTQATLQAALPILNPGIQAPGGTLSFNCGPQVHLIPITTQIFLSGDTTVDGGNLVGFDGQGQTRIFFVGDEFTRVTIKNTRLTRGFAANDFGGAVLVTGGAQLTLISSTIELSRAGLTGGAIAVAPNAFLSVTDSLFAGNRARDGGAIASSSATEIFFSTFTNNGAEVDQGGALQIWTSSLLVEESFFESNFAANGGAILQRGATATLRNVGFVDNDASLDGGAYLVYENGVAEMFGASFSSNVANRDGGAIQIAHGDFLGFPLYSANRVHLEDSVLVNNRALRNGGGVASAVLPGSIVGGGAMLLTRTTLQQNQAVRGGGLYVAGPFAYSSSTIRTSSATEGAGIYLDNNTGLPLVQGAQLTVRENVASSAGGGLFVQNGASPFGITLRRIHFDGNRAFNGGGIAVRGLGDTRVEFVSLINNEATSAGGGLYVEDDDARVENTTFSGNRAIGGSNFGGAGGDIYVRNVAINNSSVDVKFSTLYFGDASQGSALFAEGGGPGVFSRIRVNRSVVQPSPLSGPVASSSGSALVESTGDNIGVALPGCTVCGDVVVPTFGDLVLSSLQALPNGTFGRFPESGSPVVDSVGCDGFTQDQGERPRPVGGLCDRGAVERQPPVVDPVFANGFE